MLKELQQQMPSRTLKLSSAGDGGLFTQLIMGLAGTLGAVALSYAVFTMTQGILKDRKMIDNYTIVETASVSGECSAKKFISSCDVEITNNGQTIERSFSFVDFSKDDHNVEIISQKDDPSNINVDLALNKMTNRILTVVGMLVIALIALFWGISVFRAIPKKQRLKNLMNESANQPWEFVAIPAIVDTDEVTYSTEVDGQPMELALNFQGRKPIILEDSGEKVQVLGIKAKTQNTTVILDNKLKNIDFTKEEKKSLLAIIKS